MAESGNSVSEWPIIGTTPHTIAAECSKSASSRSLHAGMQNYVWAQKILH
jgi:hypothetical protein